MGGRGGVTEMIILDYGGEGGGRSKITRGEQAIEILRTSSVNSVSGLD